MAQNKLLDPIVSSPAVLVGVGNGTLTVDRLTHFTITQNYTATCIQISPSTVFSIVGSLDGPVGLATVGTQFIDSDLKIFLTIQQGVTPFQVGDQFTLGVTQGTDLSQDNIDDYDELPQKNFGLGTRGALSGDHNIRYSNSARKAKAYHQDLFFEAVAAGNGGNSIQVQYTPGTAGSEVASAAGNLISVTMENGKSTAQQILTAILAAPTVTALINATLIGVGANPQFDSGTLISLTGGKDKQFALNHDQISDSGAFVEGNASVLVRDVTAQGSASVAGHAKVGGTLSLEDSSVDNLSGDKVPNAQQWFNRLIQDQKAFLKTADDTKVTWSKPNFTFEADLVIRFPDTNFQNTVAVANSPISIADTFSLYVILDRTQTKVLTPFVAAAVPTIINAYRIATRIGDDLILHDNTLIRDGKSARIGEGSGAGSITPINYHDDSATTLPSSTGDANLDFFASYALNEDADFSVGSNNGTLNNGAVVAGGALNLIGLSDGNASYNAVGNADFTNTGTIRFKVTPNYSGSPGVDQIFVHIGANANFTPSGNPDWIGFGWSSFYGQLYLGLTAGGAGVHDNGIGAWSPVSGQTYEFELNIDTSSIIRIFIDGVLFYSFPLSLPRNASATTLIVGQPDNINTTTNFKIEEFVIYDAVQHTAGYSAPSAAPNINYMPDGFAVVTNDLVLFTALSNPAQNERIYKATISGNSISWALQILGQNPTGAPADGDGVYILAGEMYGDQLWFYNGTDWFFYTRFITPTTDSSYGNVYPNPSMTGTGNTAIGQRAADSITTGNRNTALGPDALTALTTGSDNTALGRQAGTAVITSSGSTAVGASALSTAPTPGETVVVGFQAMQNANGTGISTAVAIGARALRALTTGVDNVAVGFEAGLSLTSGRDSVAVGYQALRAAVNPVDNTAVGSAALALATAGRNTAVGSRAGSAIVGGSENTLLGNFAGSGITSGNDNIAIGDTSVAGTTGSNNISIGAQAGTGLTSGSGNIYIGTLAFPESATVTGECVIGSNFAPITRFNLGRQKSFGGTPTGTVSVTPGGDASGTDVTATGRIIRIGGAAGTGTGDGGDVRIATAPAGSSGSGVNALVDRLFIKTGGQMGLGASPPQYSSFDISIGTDPSANARAFTFTRAGQRLTVVAQPGANNEYVQGSTDADTVVRNAGSTGAGGGRVLLATGSNAGVGILAFAAGETQNDSFLELDMNTNKIVNVVDPTNPQDAATKAYVDAAGGGASFASVAGENLTAGDALYISVGAGDGGRTAGRVYKLDPTNDLRYLFIGTAGATVLTGAAVSVKVGGQVTGLTGLTTGQIVWGSVTTPGGYQLLAPTTKGQWVVPVGVADSGTTMVVDDIGAIAAFKLSHRKTEDINYVLNSTFEDGVAGYSLYADAAGTSPVDGTGGSPTGVTFTRSITSPLRNIASADLAKDAANRQGTGVSYDFTIDSADQARVLEVSFDYKVLSGTFVAGGPGVDSDITIWLYDVANAVLIPLSTQKLFSNSTTITDQFSGYFQTSYNSTSYRLIFHIGSTSALAYTLKLDNIQVNPSVYVYGTPITDWATTPSLTLAPGFGTTTNTSMWTRRVGDNLEGRGTFRAGTVAATAAYIQLLAGLAIDTNKFASTTNVQGVGRFDRIVPSSTNYATTIGALPIYFDGSTTNRLFLTSNSTGTVYTSQNADGVMNTNDAVSFNFSVPILGWSSSVQMSDNADTRVVAARYKSGTSQNFAASTVTIFNYDAKEFDTHGAVTTGANWKFTAPVAGFYRVSHANSFGNATWAAGSTWESYLYKNGTLYAQLYAAENETSIQASRQTQGITTVHLNAGEFIDVRLQHTSTGTEGTNNDVTQQYIDIERLTGPSAIAATESIAARYNTGAGTLSGAANDLRYTNKLDDSHGAYNTTTGVFTVPASGRYSITASLMVDATYAVTNATELYINVNGTDVVAGSTRAGGVIATQQAAVTIHDLYLKAGDLVKIRSLAQGTTPTFNGNAIYTSFSIVRTGL